MTLRISNKNLGAISNFLFAVRRLWKCSKLFNFITWYPEFRYLVAKTYKTFQLDITWWVLKSNGHFLRRWIENKQLENAFNLWFLKSFRSHETLLLSILFALNFRHNGIVMWGFLGQWWVICGLNSEKLIYSLGIRI